MHGVIATQEYSPQSSVDTVTVNLLEIAVKDQIA